MDSNERIHRKYLDYLVFHLDKIGEIREKIEWIISEGIWFKEEGRQLNKLCDLLIKYSSCNIGIPVELKGSEKKIEKALEQIKSGKKFLENSFGLKVPYGKIAIYGPKKKYNFFIYNFVKNEFKDKF